MTEISDVDVYFKRLYSKTTNPPPISVDEFLDIMTKCKDSTIPKERVSDRLSKSFDVVISSSRMFSKMESRIYLKNINSTNNIPNENCG